MLSSQHTTRINIKAFEGGNDFAETLTRARFEELNMDLFQRTMTSVEQVLNDAKLGREDVGDVSHCLI